MLSWSNQKGWSRKQATSNRENGISSSIILNGYLMQSLIKRRSKPITIRRVHLIINGCQFIRWRMEFIWYLLIFTKILVGLHVAIAELIWNLHYYPLLQYSKGIIVMCINHFHPLLVCG
jgi:hypothetical protein